MTKYADHPLAELFPLMTDDEIKDLAADIEANGLRDNIWLCEGKILDGRNRYRACLIAGVEPRTQVYRGDNELAFVISKNLHRRHLTESQRAMVAAEITTTRHGGNRKQDQEANLPLDISRKNAAEMLNVGERTVKDAVKVKESGATELIDAVKNGEVPVSTAAKVAKLPKAKQRAAVKAGPKAVKAAAKKADDKPKPAAKTSDDRPADDPAPDPRFMPNAERAAELTELFFAIKARLISVRTDLKAALPGSPSESPVMARRIDLYGDFLANLNGLIQALDENAPEHVCPPCVGTGELDGDPCKFCDGFGIVDRGHHSGLKGKWKHTRARFDALTAEAAA